MHPASASHEWRHTVTIETPLLAEVHNAEHHPLLWLATKDREEEPVPVLVCEGVRPKRYLVLHAIVKWLHVVQVTRFVVAEELG